MQGTSEGEERARADRALTKTGLHPVSQTPSLGVMMEPEVGDGAKAARDLGLHPNLLRNWVKALEADPQFAFPGKGQMKPEQLEIERLRREVQKLKAERDILKKAAAYFGKRHEVRLHREAPGDLAGAVDVRGARCLARGFLCLVHARAQ
jgi:transposase